MSALPSGPFQIAYATNDIDRACAVLAETCGIREFRRLEGQRPAGGICGSNSPGLGQ